MDKGTDFKSKLQVTVNNDFLKRLARDLEEQEREYHRHEGPPTSRADVLRGSWNAILNTFMNAGILLQIERMYKEIDAYIIARKKSIESIVRKEIRPGREGKTTKDIIGRTICVDRVHNSDRFVNTFYNSDTIQSMYNARLNNIDLMSLINNFVQGLEAGIMSVERDTLGEDSIRKNLEQLKLRSREVQKNVERYYRDIEEPRIREMKGAEKLSEEEIEKIVQEEIEQDIQNKMSEMENSIEIKIKEICQSLMEEEIKEAEEKGIYKLVKKYEEKDAQLGAEIEKLKQRLLINTKTRENEDKLKQIDDEIKENESLQKDLRADIKNLKRIIKRLKERKDTMSLEQKKIYLRSVLNDDQISLYEAIINRTNEKNNNLVFGIEPEKEEENYAKKYCQYLILVLYQLKRLEIVPEEGNIVQVYENAVKNLNTQLQRYKDAEENGGIYGSIAIDDVQKMVTNLERLNDRLSDKLQLEVLKYIMKNNLQSSIEYVSGEKLSEVDEKIKSNGYVAYHWDLGEVGEIKGISHFREIVARQGTAAYGNGRQVNASEKVRNMDLLKSFRLMKAAKKEKVVSLKEPQKISYLKDKIEERKRFSKIVKQLLHGEKIDEKRQEYRKNLLSIIPMYSESYYDRKTKTVKVKYFSQKENVEKYYLETNVVSNRESVKKVVKRLVQLGALTDKPIIIEISQDEYANFLKNDLERVRGNVKCNFNKVVNSLKVTEPVSLE